MKSKENKKPGICMVDNCNNQAVSRGICRNCYSAAQRLTKSGRITWRELEEKGKVLKAHHDAPTRDYFLS